jgi:hypothetical protein
MTPMTWHELVVEHDAGDHADYIEVDCPRCREESEALNMADDLPPMEFSLFDAS